MLPLVFSEVDTREKERERLFYVTKMLSPSLGCSYRSFLAASMFLDW